MQTHDQEKRVKSRLLTQKLKGPLPGLSAQRIMAPRSADAAQYYQVSDTARHAAVMLLLYQKGSEWHTLFMKRSIRQNDKHSGQLSFPGGKKDLTDKSLKETALRETNEEVGISSDDIDIIGSLSPLYVYASDFVVQPYVGITHPEVEIIKNDDEVDKVITAPMKYFDQREILKHTNLEVRNMVIKDVPYFDLYGEVLWGATAMMFSEFLYLWREL